MATKKHSSVTRDEVELCFRALGIPADATPAQVDSAFRTFRQRCARGMESADQMRRERARADMEMICQLHSTITRTLSYRDRVNLVSPEDEPAIKTRALVMSVCALMLVAIILYLNIA